MIFIKNGMIVDPEGDRLYKADLVIGDGKIQEIVTGAQERAEVSGHNAGKTGGDGPEVTIIDGRGLVIGPGLADTHVHFRDPGFTYKEDIDTGAAAAAKGDLHRSF